MSLNGWTPGLSRQLVAYVGSPPTGHREDITRKPDLDEDALEALIVRVLGRPMDYERAGDGVSTQVYRIASDRGALYLRVAEEAGDSMAVEVEVHHRLRQAGASVAEVVHFEDRDVGLGRSFAITTEIAGVPVGYDDPSPSVLRAAGRDFARIASIPVEGFGWLRGDVGERLVGEDGDFRTSAGRIVLDQLESMQVLLGGEAVEALAALIESLDDVPDAHLAHGDLDATHVYTIGGTYSGIIDFGEIRGAEPHYDVAHFFLHHGASVEHVIAGYRDISTIDLDPIRLRRTAILIGAFRVAWGFHRYGEAAANQQGRQWYAKRTASLLLDRAFTSGGLW